MSSDQICQGLPLDVSLMGDRVGRDDGREEGARSNVQKGYNRRRVMKEKREKKAEEIKQQKFVHQ